MRAATTFHRVIRRATETSRGTARYLSDSAAAALPEGLEEIYSVPSTLSWSLKELHQEGAVLNAADVVLTEEKLRELAELCHLHLDDDKVPGLLKDVEAIIQCTKTIQAMTISDNIDDVYSTSNFDADIVAPLRDDVVTAGDCADKILANAAERSGYYFKVPKVMRD
uniref:Glutamyl-tRNA(Gln) amidotransferase subunit C, mitochondrial n=1 Tax=Peronospora matthiolae TaxID=2874970 RepID=A0AAV1TT83_9STRA